MKYIYALLDPRNNEIRYIGKADDTAVRLQNHMCPSNLSKRKHSSRWLRLLRDNGLRPVLIILEEMCDNDDWEQAEKDWIKHMRAEGCRLTNCTAGGEGGATYGRLGVPWSEEQHDKYARSRTWVKINQRDPHGKRAVGLRDAFAKMRAAGIKKKGPIHTVATKILLRNLRLGKEITLNAKRKMTLRKMGKSPSVLSLLRKMKGEH